jgi:Pyruvate/2-oxoacid:ferredoxin oxidoreductase delta subunit
MAVKSNGDRPPIGPDRLKLDWYAPAKPAIRNILSAEERLANPYDEVDLGITQEQALAETTRCFSCGKCFGCENCWMYCQASCFTKIHEQVTLGHFFDLNTSVCDGCKKCSEECPCGFIDLI